MHCLWAFGTQRVSSLAKDAILMQHNADFSLKLACRAHLWARPCQQERACPGHLAMRAAAGESHQ